MAPKLEFFAGFVSHAHVMQNAALAGERIHHNTQTSTAAEQPVVINCHAAAAGTADSLVGIHCHAAVNPLISLKTKRSVCKFKNLPEILKNLPI